MSSSLQHRRRGQVVTNNSSNGGREHNCDVVELESGMSSATPHSSALADIPTTTKSLSVSAGSKNNNASRTNATKTTGKERRQWRWKGYRKVNQYVHHSRTIIKIYFFGFLCLLLVVTCYLVFPILWHLSSSTRIPVADVDISVPNEHDWPLIHIVHTRFMQEQGALETLGMARFHLFMTFCFPTMIAQSTQKYFWIIKTDPRFTTTTVFSLLLDAVKKHPNIYIVASNCNYSFGAGGNIWCWGGGSSWRDGAEPRDILRSNVYSGNMHKLQQAMALRDDRIVLETRLDADDGLHQYYLQYMQYVALARFRGLPIKLKSTNKKQQKDGDDGAGEEEGGEKDRSEDEDDHDNGEEQEFVDDKDKDIGEQQSSKPPQWLYWCARRHLEWHSALDNHADTSLHEAKRTYDQLLGLLTPIQHEKLCITPGITVGYNVGTDPRTVPRHEHDKLFLKVNGSEACYYDFDNIEPSNVHEKKKTSQGTCLELVDDFLFCALRSRTWTSAGMQRVPLDPSSVVEKKVEKQLWQLLEERFNMNQTRVRLTQDYLIHNRKLIAQENILGQCTSGHSCKTTAKNELRQYIEEDSKKQATADTVV
jgi:hypothetical protein